ncbi:hypothetical protein BDV18DRAFT_166268 [Aspergillus unguis]
MMAYRGKWRSSGNAGSGGRHNGFRKRNQQETPCRFFQRGKCHYGDGCRFSHESTGAADFKWERTAADYLDARNPYLDWKRLLRRGIRGSGYSQEEHDEILQFWNGALEILESDDSGNHQSLAKDLVDDKLQGLEFVLATADADNPEGSRRIPAYHNPFLKVITHASLLNCLSVDTFVGTLYTTFGGTNGDRAIRYLRSICRWLTDTGTDASESAPVASFEMVKLLLHALYQLLSRVARARFHDELSGLLDLTGNLISEMRQTCSNADIDGLQGRLEVMRSLMPRASGTPVITRCREGSHPAESSFPMDIQVPGGRHDNDFAEISRVLILPTHQEIVSSDSEYLPSTNFLQPHILADPLQRYIDWTFRLLRHDTFGSVKEILQDLLKQDDLAQTSYRSIKDSGAHVYLGAQVQQVFINDRNELEATVSFSTPPQLRQKSSNEQSRWWQDSSRLEEGSLVCLVASQGTSKRLIFLEITVKNACRDKTPPRKSSLVSDRFPPSITVKLATCRQPEVALLGQLYRAKVSGVLVDFHGVIPATFVPILKNLQRIHREGELAFQKWVLPGYQTDQDDKIPPPAYARKAGFVFPLNSITKPGADGLTLDPNTPEHIDILRLQNQTGLDRGQCHGLIAALTREYALIQGPPGTGKSYVVAKLGPIVVICYTNHALDQFLKHLLDVGIQKMIRIGGRSQATELDGKNLRVVSQVMEKTRVESQTLGMTYSDLEKCMKSAGYALKPLHQSQHGLSWPAMANFLRLRYPKIHAQLEQPDLEGFITVADDKLLNWLGTKEWQEDGSAILFESLDRAASLREHINAVHEEVNRRALMQAHVVGITTTALARHIETLRRLGSKVIICEEAAEVMEAHVTSALMPGVEHFIQIGDHRQLRPQIRNHSLSLEAPTRGKWQLDRSQFERRAVGEPGLKPAPIAQLNVQRRMRPEISQLIRRVYPTLEDHPSVKRLPNVVGMWQNLFWLDHRYNEDLRDDGSRVKSHSNQWEVDMATALVRHLVRQGTYSSKDIALLTPYTGQLRKLRTSLSSDFEICLSERDLDTLAADGFEDTENGDVNGKVMEKKTLVQTLRLATVDNFQGEEAKVIVVSLVRSNPKRKVGFLRTENRINVLLSRAQHGMYLIGNTETYMNVPMWAEVHSQLAGANAVGTELALCCPRHPETPIICAEPPDFELKSPEGGCSLPCPRRLEPCGHQCQAKCHSAVMHDSFACTKPCPRIRRSCEHECPKLCGQECGRCMTKIEDVELPCGHTKKAIFCHQKTNLKAVRCDIKVEKTIPKCGHTVQVSCFKDVTSPIFHCPEPCTGLPSCGHSCSGCCGRCLIEAYDGQREFSHLKCTKKCDRPYSTCNHRCPKTCHTGEDCGPCEAKCEVRCSHSVCDSTCGKACTPCIEKCTWSCIHQGSCSLPCAAPCDRLPCDERCPKLLECGHQCPSLCGEDCPNNVCQGCGNNMDARVDFLEWQTFSEINLDECPIIMLACGHFFTRESVDGLIGLPEVYTSDQEGRFNGLRDISYSLASTIPSCPDCKQPIRQFATKRYNRVINRAVMDETYRRFLVKGRTELEGLEARLHAADEMINLGRKHSIPASVPSWRNPQYADCERVSKDALTLSKTMEAENQPIKRLKDAIVASQRDPCDEIASISARIEAMSTTIREPDNQITLGAWLIHIRAQEVILSHTFKVITSSRNLATLIAKPPPNLTGAMNACLELITQANKAGLSRIVITATIVFAKLAQQEAWYRRTYPGEPTGDLHQSNGLQQFKDRTETIRGLLAAAAELCDGLGNCPDLHEQLHGLIRLHERPQYETITPDELQSIKTAMVSGRAGIATHSGHWYNCANGHPFAVGECGLPMEQARCPECGAPIGGQNHRPVDGVTRAQEME